MSWQGRDFAEDAVRVAGARIGGKAREVRKAVIRQLLDRHRVDPGRYVALLSTLARDTGFSERQVQRAVAFWRRLGLLDTLHRGGRRASIYRLRLDTTTTEARP